MQPDLLSPEKEEIQPKPLTSEANLPAQPPVEEATDANSSPTVRKNRSKAILAYVGLGVLIFLLVAAIGWVGYWAYDLSNQLTNTHQQLAVQQADYAKLQTDYETLNTTLKGENEKLNAELTQVKSDLEKAKADLSAAQAESTKFQDQNKLLTTQLDKAGKLALVLKTFTSMQAETDIFVLEKQIKDAGNEGLSKAWSNVKSSPSEQSFKSFLDSLILAIQDGLK